MPKVCIEEEIVSTTNTDRKPGFQYSESETRPCLSLHKAKLKRDQGPQHKTWYPETARGKDTECTQFIGTGKDFLNRCFTLINPYEKISVCLGRWLSSCPSQIYYDGTP